MICQKLLLLRQHQQLKMIKEIETQEEILEGHRQVDSRSQKIEDLEKVELLVVELLAVVLVEEVVLKAVVLEEVVLEVRTCPAIAYLRAHGREIVPCFCQHCHFVSAAMGEGAGVEVRVQGGNGSCTQRFALAGHLVQPQQMEDIATAT